MKQLRLKFTDFWPGFAPSDNYFFKLLSRFCAVELDDEPDVVIYSSYRREYLKYDCTRVFYTGENVRPDFSGCDFALSCDFTDRPNHYRLPLYALYIERAKWLPKLLSRKSREEALATWRRKQKFCCMVVSNDNSPRRIELFKKLSAYKRVDSGGRILNNIGGPVANKMQFIRDYRFVISFENSSYPGYTTEKILEPLVADCIPLYWGNSLIGKDFNPACFLHLDHSKSEEQFIREIIAVDSDEEKAVQLLTAPTFPNNTIPPGIDEGRVLRFFQHIVGSLETFTPVARTSKRYIHAFKVRKRFVTGFAKGIAGRIFRRLVMV